MTLSVVIPAFNREHLLGATLESLLQQTLPADEIIVVDDGSTDETLGVAKSFGDRVRVIQQENSGPGAARNRGFQESRGEFIHFFDSDDLAAPNKHQVQIQTLEESGGDIAYGPWVKGKITELGFEPEGHVLQLHGLPKGDLAKALLTNWSIVPHTCLFRRSIVEKVGGFPEELYVAEDQLMFLRCLLAGAKVVHSAGTLELYRTNVSGKLTASNAEARTRQYRDWARFLLQANCDCENADISPSKWRGFRARAWQAHEDLTRSGMQCDDLLEPLESIFRSRRGREGYRLGRFLSQKVDGLKMRLTGSRAPWAFRSGKFSEQQRALTQSINFQPEPPRAD